MKKVFSIIVLMAALLVLGACGSQSAESDPATSNGDGDGQNPVMNYVGTYGADRATVLIEAEGSDGVKATVTWGSSAWQTSEWTMSGTFDSEQLSFHYDDCTLKEITFKDDGNVDSEKTTYTDGSGSMQFHEGDELTLTWDDEKDHAADGMVFTYFTSPEE